MDSCSIQTTHERLRIDDRIRNFEYEESEAWAELRKRGWDQLRQAELLSIALLLSMKLKVPIDREAKRRKNVLVKWFDENLAELRMKMDYVSLVFKNDEATASLRE